MTSGNRRLLSTIALILVVGISFLIGQKYGKETATKDAEYNAPIISTDQPADSVVDFSSFWKVWRTLDDKFVPSSTSTEDFPTDQERVWGAISGMVDSLDDPYTVFLPPEEAEIFESDISGNFEGVGMEIGVRDGVLTVISPLKNTPAYRAGVQSGDKILKIDDSTTERMNADQAVRLIRGKVGTKVVLTILREGEEAPRTITITRAVVSIPTIDHEIRGDGVFVIRLYNFSATSPNLFRQALREFVRTGSDKLVLDLRGNPGGYLEASVDMASWFLPTGKVIVREQYRETDKEIQHRSRGYDIFTDRLKMAILIDHGSASASEILAGALKEHGVAKLVGETSFGKGSVQELVKITPDTSLKVTIAKWLTPDGLSISAGGLVPDVLVERTPADVTAGRDPQMAAAVELLKNW